VWRARARESVTPRRMQIRLLRFVVRDWILSNFGTPEQRARADGLTDDSTPSPPIPGRHVHNTLNHKAHDMSQLAPAPEDDAAARHGDVEILRRLTREAFQEITTLRDRCRSLEKSAAEERERRSAQRVRVTTRVDVVGPWQILPATSSSCILNLRVLSSMASYGVPLVS